MEDKLRKRLLAKITCFIILIINIFGMSLLQTGCLELEYEQITIGDYVYAINKKINAYLIVDLSAEGKQKETIVLPNTVNQKNIGFGGWGGGFSGYKLVRSKFITSNMKKLLIENLIKKNGGSYNNTVRNLVACVEFENKENYEKKFKLIINCYGFQYIATIEAHYNNINYMRLKLYNEKIYEHIDYLKNVLGEDYSFERDINYLRPANVEFHWNYENSPQEDYYWIDDIEDGELIEEIPPIPEREGYTFGGWYTEKECINEFSFSTPISKMDIDWEELYNSRQQVPDEYVTSLYAKWIVI